MIIIYLGYDMYMYGDSIRFYQYVLWMVAKPCASWWMVYPLVIPRLPVVHSNHKLP